MTGKFIKIGKLKGKYEEKDAKEGFNAAAMKD